MAKITRNGNTVNFNRIAAFGCSHTEGAELADASFVENKTADEVDRIKRDYCLTKDIPSFYADIMPVDINELRSRQNKLSWPNYVADAYNVPILNLGESGSSLGQIVFRIEEAIKTGVVDLENDLILVGITSPDRFFMIHANNKPDSGIFGNMCGWPSAECKEQFEFLDNEHYLTWQVFTTMTHLNALDQVTNNRIIAAYAACNLTDLLCPSIELYSDMLRGIDKMDFILDNSLSLLHFTKYNDENTHGFSHPKIPYHKAFAKNIVDRLEDPALCDKTMYVNPEDQLKEQLSALRKRDPFIYY